MRIAVVGAGVAGVATASELAADGHHVVVFERRASLAAESSFAHAGIAAPGLLVPWTEPVWPAGGLRHWLRRRDPWPLGWPLRPKNLRWMSRARAASGPTTPQAPPPRLLHLQRLAVFSRERMRALVGALRLGHERADGGLVLFRTAGDASRIQPWLAAARDLGLRLDPLDEEGCRAIEPGLNPDTRFFGGVHVPQAEVGNARQFALLLRDEVVRMGADFRLSAEILRIEPGSRPTVVWRPSLEPDAMDRRAQADSNAETFDAVVVCAGERATELLKPHRIPLAVAPVHGWSITASVRRHEAHPDPGPRSAVIDGAERVAIGRIGGRLRVSGGFRLGGARPDPEPPAALYRALDRWFPGAMQPGQVQRWVGTASSTPDGLPVLGESGAPGVWLNLGHGHAGWSLCCGAARLIADGVAGRRGAIDLAPYGVARWAR